MKKTTYIAGMLLMLPLWLQAQSLPATTRIDNMITIFSDVMRQVDINYADTLNYEEMLEYGLAGMLHKIDPYTIYIPAKKEDDLKRMTTGKYAGVGAVIMQRDSAVYVSDPYEGQPAQRNGLIAGDQILEVDGKSCLKKTTADVSNMLRGKAGTTVTIKVKRLGVDKPIKIAFEREEIRMEPIEYYGVIPGTRTGYIQFSEFTDHSARDFRSALQDMMDNRHIEQLIIDLRGNGGGIITEAVSILSLFLPEGTEVVTTKGKTDNSCRSYYTIKDMCICPDMPLVVLVDGHSASASEITCGALQDLKRAKLIGEKTFGKGLVQSVRDVALGGHLKVTTSKYYLPSGRCIQGTGIEPDIVLNDTGKVDICYELYNKHFFFDYANEYRMKHTEIAEADSFQLTDSDIEDFIVFLKDKGFVYETETYKYFKDVLKMAEQEDLSETTIQALRDMQEKINPSYEEAVRTHADEVRGFLGAEIVSRYYYQKGRAAYMLRTDKGVLRALEELKK